MRYRSIDWELLNEHYYLANIKAINFSIIDMSVEDIYFKAHDGAVFLNELIQKYQVIKLSNLF